MFILNKHILLRGLRSDQFVCEQVHEQIRMASSSKWHHNEQQFHDCSNIHSASGSLQGMQMLKIRTKQALPATPYGVLRFQRQFGGQRGCWSQQKSALLSLVPQQTYYAAVGVRGERLEAGWGGGRLPLVDGSLLHPKTSCPDTHTHQTQCQVLGFCSW